MADTDLPFCGECGGEVKHERDCSAYDPGRQITAPAGWCAPSQAVYEYAREQEGKR